MVVAGIHFGNTNSVISVYKNGRVETVSNETGDRITPTIVAYTGNEKVVGQPAKQFHVRNPLSCVTQIKASIGQSFTDEHINQLTEGASCEMLNDNGTISFKVKVDQDFVKVSAIDAASYIFTNLLEIAEHVGGNDLEDVVLAVPHNFSEEQKISLCEAATNIGCNVLRVISEPAAALLAYGIGQEDPTLCCTALVFRLGGSTADATIMEVNNGMYRFVDQKTLNHFGGHYFDQVLLKHLIKDFRRKYNEDISENKRAVGKLQSALETCKFGLSKQQSTQCTVESLHDGIDFQTQIARAKFESLCSEAFSKCTRLIDDLLQSNCMSESQIDKVVLVGGGLHVPRLVSLIESRFKSSEVLKQIAPDELLAQGAALQASLLEGKEDVLLNSTVPSMDCVTRNIGVKIVDENQVEKLEVIIPKNTPFPTRRSKCFECNAAQVSVCISIFESRDDTLEKLLAKLVMRELGTNSKNNFNLTFEIKQNRVLYVTLNESNSNSTECLTIDLEHL